ncbi:uncharacterized protein LOC123260759 isoform X1 [Cotesia glomerata]|uniref:uncharacterized protein LOC123260759 isoform X1 n=1 Tax=Cotesia glomerata TaxID=32391 RepID=UPI001D00666F|nr:uncharacterized protein LOC123260759 isoform X1 [Cotesia glomerata]
MNDESGKDGSSPESEIARLSFDKNNDNDNVNVGDAIEEDAKSTSTITELNVDSIKDNRFDGAEDTELEVSAKNYGIPILAKQESFSEEKKKGRLKNPFKDRLFKRKKTGSIGSQPSIDENETEPTKRTVTNKSVEYDEPSQAPEQKLPAIPGSNIIKLSGLGVLGSSFEVGDDEDQDSDQVPVKKMMKKKKTSLVRRLSLNKFRLSSTEQIPEVRQTPEGDSSRSQSSQESPSHEDSIKTKSASSGSGSIAKKGYSKFEDKSHLAETQKGRDNNKSKSVERRSSSGTWGQREKGLLTTTTTSERRIDDPHRRRHKPSENSSTDKTVTTVTTVLQRRSPSVTIRTSFIEPDLPPVGQESPRSVSTLPSAVSKWPETKGPPKKSKFPSKLDRESGLKEFKPGESPPLEAKRKLSLVKEKRAIFQRKYFETSEVGYSQDNSLDTVVGNVGAGISDSITFSDNAISIDNDDIDLNKRKPSRHISVRTFDSFSTTFKESVEEQDPPVEEDQLHSIDITDHNNRTLASLEDQNYSSTSMAVSSAESIEIQRRFSGDTTSTHNNAPNSGVTEKREHLYKILVIGELGAGKTSIIKRYVHQFFSQHYRATIGVDFALKVLNWDPNTIIRLQLWDIAGQERFGNMTRVYYKEAVGAFIVFDVTRSATLDAVVKWKQDLDSKVQLPDGSPIPCVLLANKCDQSKEGLANSPGKMDDYCKEKNFVGWFETSAKENINIEEAARFLVNKILQNDQIMKGNGAQDQVDGERFALNQSPTGSKKSCAC